MEYIHRLRQKVGHEKVLIPATALVILNPQDEVLLHLRNHELAWGLPGGLMDLGETVSESVGREALEETGLKIRKPKVYGIFSGPTYEVQYPGGDQTSPVIIACYTNEYSGELRPSTESPELKFCALDQLPAKMNESHRRFIEAFREWRHGDLTVLLR